MAAAVDLRLQAVAEVIWPVAGVVATWAVAGAVAIWRVALAAGVVRESAKAISITVALIMATTSPWSMSTTTLTTGSYVTASSLLAVGGGRTTMTMGITA